VGGDRVADDLDAADGKLPEPTRVRLAELGDEIGDLELRVRRDEPGRASARPTAASAGVHETDRTSLLRQCQRGDQAHHAGADDDDVRVLGAPEPR
jgi:hypothetical protein